MKNPPKLFDSSSELKSMMEKLEHGDIASAHELLRRIGAQRGAIAALGKFGRGLDQRSYKAALDLVPAVVNRAFGSADRLETQLLRLEIDFTRAVIAEQRSTSAKRFRRFWDAFDAIALRRTHRDAQSVYQAVMDSGIAPPYPGLRRAKDHYKELMDGNSQRLQIAG